MLSVTTKAIRRAIICNQYNVRFSSSTSSSNYIQTTDSDDGPQEEEFIVSELCRNKLVPETPIKSLNLSEDIKKVAKKGSFSVDIFTGSYDADYLTYPEPLKNRIQNQKLKDQAVMVRQLWPQIWDDQRQLQKFNFFNLYQLSVTEMMSVFEAIGSSSWNCQEYSLTKTDDHNNEVPKQILVSKTIISLIIRNCLTYWPMNNSGNENLKQYLPQKHILFGGSEDVKELHLPIGFCWTEKAPNLGSLPPQEWQSLSSTGGVATNNHLISGRKTSVLCDDSTENYLVFYRDKFLSEKFEQEFPEDEPNPASDGFVGCSLVNKAELKFGAIQYDSAGFKYSDVQFDTVIPNDRLVFPARRRDPTALNIKALGQLATCSVTLGMMKDALRRTYRHLFENKRGLLSCDVIERKLTGVTYKIFAIESMVYYISGMYDGLEDGFDAHMEATILKIVTNEYSYEILQELQQVCGSELFMISKLQDQVNIFDSFLDGNIYNRLYLATMGILWFARSKNMHLNQLRLAPWYPGYFIKYMIKQKFEEADWLTLNADIFGSLHPSLREAGENLEYILKRVKYAADNLCLKHGKDVTSAQSSLYKLAQLSIDSFVLTTTCARASKSYCNGSRGADIDIALVTQVSRELANKVRLYIEAINVTSISAMDSRASMISQLNLRNGGYYAESPLDPNL